MKSYLLSTPQFAAAPTPLSLDDAWGLQGLAPRYRHCHNNSSIQNDQNELFLLHHGLRGAKTGRIRLYDSERSKILFDRDVACKNGSVITALDLPRYELKPGLKLRLDVQLSDENAVLAS